MIEKIIILALFTIGYCCTFWPGMIFEKAGNWLELQLPEWLWKPIGGCYICTAFWLGSAVYWVTWHNSLHEWFITVIGAMGFNAVISEFTNKPVEIEAEEPIVTTTIPIEGKGDKNAEFRRLVREDMYKGIGPEDRAHDLICLYGKKGAIKFIRDALNMEDYLDSNEYTYWQRMLLQVSEQ
jgi:hypothetical protein